jgi:NAD(P)-dependent dehydrogenase (short-subunit alcohol dehydrogenase family)
MDISGKIALVTGGAHRVGKAITMMLANNGAHVVVNYHASGESAIETVKEVRALGVDAIAIQCDVADWQAVQLMAEQVQGHFGHVDIIINGASSFVRTPFPTEDVTSWRRVISVSIDGTFYVCNSLVPMMPDEGGSVVNIVDAAATQPWPNFAAHGVGKAGMLALTRQLALELAPKIRVNAVSPGYVLAPPHFSAEQVEASAERTLLERWGKPDDVAGAVNYLLEADYVTGEVIVVDGGERYGPRPKTPKDKRPRGGT